MIGREEAHFDNMESNFNTPRVSSGAHRRSFSVFKKVKKVIHRELTKGLDLRSGSRAIASAFTFGIFPIIGFSTPLNTLSALVFKLNQPIVQAINWVLGPLKLLLIFPFLRFGEWLFSAEPFTLSLTEFSSIFFDDWIATTQEFAWTFVHVITGWLILAPLIYPAAYLVAKSFLAAREIEVAAEDSECCS